MLIAELDLVNTCLHFSLICYLEFVNFCLQSELCVPLEVDAMSLRARDC